MRIAFNIGLIVSILYLPWWVGAGVAVVGAFMIDRFFEVVLYGILADALYGTRFGFHGFSHVATAYAATLCAVSLAIRKRLAW